MNCSFYAGDIVFFKAQKKKSKRDYWVVSEVIANEQNIKWSRNGKTPLFIKLERRAMLAGGKSQMATCFTSPFEIAHKDAE